MYITLNIPLLSRRQKIFTTNYRHLLPDLALSNKLFMVPRVFKPLWFDCTWFICLNCYDRMANNVDPDQTDSFEAV